MPPSRSDRPPAPKRGDAQKLSESGLGEGFGFLLSRAGVLTTEIANAALEPLDLTVQEYMILALATVTPPPSQRELSQVLRLHPSRIVELVDRLERLGRVARSTSPTDRRVNQVGATEEGLRLRETGAATLTEAHTRQFAHVDPELLAAFKPLLRQIALIDRPERR